MVIHLKQSLSTHSFHFSAAFYTVLTPKKKIGEAQEAIELQRCLSSLANWLVHQDSREKVRARPKMHRCWIEFFIYISIHWMVSLYLSVFCVCVSVCAFVCGTEKNQGQKRHSWMYMDWLCLCLCLCICVCMFGCERWKVLDIDWGRYRRGRHYCLLAWALVTGVQHEQQGWILPTWNS